ncbi:class I SAM-dependent methyltransferase [Helicobacter turcicus]|uniref:Class I SAM-dependent methyltransferase n=1 Tax=Helicobacter turcicus TaxID=2867412 RepID=A0ABS7JPP8_9HELI|nr:methyltransferase domain-containing protein [Helicobacter turcicus]MBX7491345.1 class I SAM-dependent methyltransferase [Helicobacter turcicus]MBX7546168.1 class I SAM-dependent methyltransferase [Helicobacter turcicus]
MQRDALKWDIRHRENPIPTRPLELLKTHIAKARVGKALDIACGMGRNSKFMRDCGFCVDSVDVSSYAISSLQGEKGINAQCVDLDTFKIPPCSYDLICKSYFLERRLFPYMIEGLKKDGILVFETFVQSNVELHNAFARDSAHLLRKNELLRAFLDLEVLFYEEALIVRSKDSGLALVARLVAQKSD